MASFLLGLIIGFLCAIYGIVKLLEEKGYTSFKDIPNKSKVDKD